MSQKWPISLEFFKKPEMEVDFFWNFEGFKLEFFKFSRYFSKKFEKFALKTLIFQKTRNGSWFFFKFFKVLGVIVAKSFENLTFFSQFFKKPETEVDFFEIFNFEFFKFSRYFSKKFEKFAFKTLIFPKTGNGSWFFTGSKLFFSKFLMFWAL